MKRIATKTFRIASATAMGAACLFVGENISLSKSWVSEAQAIIGRPITPMSYAGVARRTTRRAVTYGAAAGAAAAAAAPVIVAPAPTCVQVVDAYGRVTIRCP